MCYFTAGSSGTPSCLQLQPSWTWEHCGEYSGLWGLVAGMCSLYTELQSASNEDTPVFSVVHKVHLNHKKQAYWLPQKAEKGKVSQVLLLTQHEAHLWDVCMINN